VPIIQLQRQTYRCKCGFVITGLTSNGVIVGRPDMVLWRSLCIGNAEKPRQCRYLRASAQRTAASENSSQTEHGE
jgi:hypothetical protein